MQREEIAEAIVGFENIEALSLTDDGDDIVLAVFGYQMIEDNEAECFALLGKNCGYKLLEVVRYFKRFIPMMMEKRKCRRVMMTVRCDFGEGRRFAEMLSFKAVEILPSFFMGRDYQVYERIEEKC